ncbi:MAG: hypothetical protein KatS3mg105_4541 [Gemmatales bacterium]|nr:MAG: hypothetical protein KatS3mg105_4541 [Gemmatales bacterium]
MEEITCKLSRNGADIVDNVKGRLTIDYNPNREELWSGFVNLPSDSLVQVGEVYEVTLSDGRSSRVQIERVNVTGQGVFASFKSDLV